jgi:pilus assembly protein Flp/PilA
MKRKSTMQTYLIAWLRLKTDRRAVTALEYGLIAALVAGVLITAVTLLGTNLSTKFAAIAAAVGTSAS